MSGEYRDKNTVGFYTLGCKVNQYDTQAMIEQFKARGYRIVDFNQKADIYVINTCTVTNLADRKSRQMIRKAHRANSDALIAVVGCFAQRAANEAIKIPGVKLVLGTQHRKEIVDFVERVQKTGQSIVNVNDIMKAKDFEDTPISSYQGRTRAILKIQEGCNQFCSYCIIPYTRGPIRSRHPGDVLQEVCRLVEAGFKEIVLTGIHLASYGTDLQGANLVSLLQDINSVQGLARIRLGSLEPNYINDDFIKGIQDLEKVCSHFHIPLQSGSDTVLKRMNRKYTAQEYAEAIEKIRQYYPEAAITTDVMVGFPGETDSEFQESLEFVKRIGFSRLHVFQYSPREGTLAANMSSQVPADEKEKRSQRLIETGHQLAQQYMEHFVNRVEKVYFEQRYPDSSDFYEGYTEHYVKVRVHSNKDIRGLILDVDLEKIENDYMIGQLNN
ncbi:MAG: tRNA (N(6)-L-threonylcarbamoyladenosine(37)-C(2))-methylthiotransferase MtaB [Clostridiales bacterium]|nr:tRNA (N(6)-L-threonylcarbamoyladenosine(37)-C(2))-methylthiotransferase MtaB [Clostridiales bacterium]